MTFFYFTVYFKKLSLKCMYLTSYIYNKFMTYYRAYLEIRSSDESTDGYAVASCM